MFPLDEETTMMAEKFNEVRPTGGGSLREQQGFGFLVQPARNMEAISRI